MACCNSFSAPAQRRRTSWRRPMQNSRQSPARFWSRSFFPLHSCRIVRAMRLPLLRGYSVVGHQRADAAGKAEDARPAFALDLLGVEAKRGDAAIDGKA